MIQKYVQYNEKLTYFNLFVFPLPKKGAEANQKKSAPAQILNRLRRRLQPKNLGSDRLRNTSNDMGKKKIF